jgi:hypothetical protein
VAEQAKVPPARPAPTPFRPLTGPMQACPPTRIPPSASPLRPPRS